MQRLAPLPSKERLLALRRKGDPLGDDTIAAIFESGDIDDVRRLLRHLVDNDHPLLEDEVPESERLPTALRQQLETYFERSDAALPTLDAEKILAGERMFANHGPEILMILGCYSLPASYAARRGVQVLAQTRRLESHPKRRLIETTQMVVDVMQPGGLARGDHARMHGNGIRTAQKVRLMHAAIRRLILHHYGDKWVDEYGVPINQMDLAGTLMTFSWIVLDGLHKLGEKPTPEEEEAYLYAWRAVATIVGVRDELLPQSVADAETLTNRIYDLEIAPCPEGHEMTRALLEMMEQQVGRGLFRGLPASMMRMFLQKNADIIGVPKPDWTIVFVYLIRFIASLIDRASRRSRLVAALYRSFTTDFIRGFLVVERGGNRPAFTIPDHLADGWGITRDRSG